MGETPHNFEAAHAKLAVVLQRFTEGRSKGQLDFISENAVALAIQTLERELPLVERRAAILARPRLARIYPVISLLLSGEYELASGALSGLKDFVGAQTPAWRSAGALSLSLRDLASRLGAGYRTYGPARQIPPSWPASAGNAVTPITWPKIKPNALVYELKGIGGQSGAPSADATALQPRGLQGRTLMDRIFPRFWAGYSTGGRSISGRRTATSPVTPEKPGVTQVAQVRHLLRSSPPHQKLRRGSRRKCQVLAQLGLRQALACGHTTVGRLATHISRAKLA
jgi:hypothetical protein